jgi:hypothetical protein
MVRKNRLDLSEICCRKQFQIRDLRLAINRPHATFKT